MCELHAASMQATSSGLPNNALRMTPSGVLGQGHAEEALAASRQTVQYATAYGNSTRDALFVESFRWAAS